MADYSTIVNTKEGQAHISTKKRWMFFFWMPHTGVLPYPCRATDLKQFGTFIKWRTSEPATLEKLHNAIVQLVQEIGVSGLAEVVNSAKAAQQIWRTFGGADSGLQDIARVADQHGIKIAILSEVIEFIKEIQ